MRKKFSQLPQVPYHFGYLMTDWFYAYGKQNNKTFIPIAFLLIFT